ncbi:hypothetical protein ACFWR9_37640 [Streptomyces sp. NPDC058534]|uniref:hypothetical protein n=1 Tax=Streptomyces sp. NPDC058534 TaxID=3346541 RepID=UPI0036497848
MTDIVALIRVAREKGVSGYIGDGTNHWSAAHRRDSTRLMSVPAEDLAAHFGRPAGPLAASRAASSTLTRELLGWRPVGPGLIDDLRQGHCFE